MKAIKNLFKKIAAPAAKRYCACGHMVSANLPFCPHCGSQLIDITDFPLD